MLKQFNTLSLEAVLTAANQEDCCFACEFRPITAGRVSNNDKRLPTIGVAVRYLGRRVRVFARETL